MDYVRSMIDLLLDYMGSNLRALEKTKKQEEESESENGPNIFECDSKKSHTSKYAFYENEIQLLEAEVRSHIRLQQ